MKKITAWVLIFCGLIGTFSMSSCGSGKTDETVSNDTIDNVSNDTAETVSDESIKNMLTAHHWKSRSYVLVFYDNGRWEEKPIGKQLAGNGRSTWAVRNGNLYFEHYASMGLYSDYETLEIKYVSVDESDLAKGVVPLTKENFYVSDNYLVFGTSNPTIYTPDD